MICYFNIDTTKVYETKYFLSMMGISESSPGIINELNIEFINPPEVLLFLANIEKIGIYSISSIGISFYVVSMSFQENCGEIRKLEWEIKKYSDGIFFCPMSNIKSIDTVGKIVSNKEYIQYMKSK